jgi:hypothetical protein
MARVIVDGRYTFETEFEVEVGDEVLLPAAGVASGSAP